MPDDRRDAERLANIRGKYRGLQGDMPPFGDVVTLLRIVAAKDAEIAALRADFDNATTLLANVTKIADQVMESRIADLRAENERLREAVDVAESTLSRISATELIGSGAIVAATHTLCLLREALTPPQEPQ